jgi:hypothetical protein
MSGPTTPPYVQADGGASAPPAVSTAPTPPPPYGVDPRYNSGQRRGRGVLAAIGLGVVAILLAAAALVVALTGIGRQPAPAAPATAPAASQPTSTTEADRALCIAIAPLMTEGNRMANAFVDLGDTGAPARDAALPKFVSDTKDWARRIQAVLDSHPDVQPFLKRTLQRYLDDMTLYVDNVRPGPKQTYDAAAWADSLVAYGGPLAICQDLGVSWSR